MKRNLFQNVTAIPYKSGEAIDRTGFLSAVIGVGGVVRRKGFPLL